MHLKIAPQLEWVAPQVLKWGAILHLRKNSRTGYGAGNNPNIFRLSPLSRQIGAELMNGSPGFRFADLLHLAVLD